MSTATGRPFTDTNRIWLSPPHIGEEERAAVSRAFDSNWVTSLGPEIDAFEAELTKTIGCGATVTLASGTAGIHLALLVLGVTRGDEVLVQSFTFAASANPIVYCGATPVFIDSERETWNMSPQLLEAAITDRIARVGRPPKVCIIVDLYGVPAKYSELLEVCERYGVVVIEDAAEAFGSSYRGKPAGAFGSFSILSFNGNKIITTSGGGALCCPSAEIAAQIRHLATQARDPAPHYQHSKIGYNYRMSNLLAGIGRAQLAKLSQRVAARRSNFARYVERLSSLESVEFPKEPKDTSCNRWLTTPLFNRDVTSGAAGEQPMRERIRLALEAKNIESRPLWKPLHLQPVFAECPRYVDGTSEELFRIGLCLPSGSNLTTEQHEAVCDAVINAVNR
jgi:dTDP-4-amino-4,6-dideoxygalactose transaminase